MASSETLGQDIRDALARNATELNPISVAWTEQYTSSRSPGETIAQLKIPNPPDNDLFARRSWRLSWQDGKVYCLRRQAAANSCEYSFDGSVFYMGVPDVPLPDKTFQPRLNKFLISRLAKDNPGQAWFITDYFHAAGLSVPSLSAELAGAPSIQSAVIQLLQNPTSRLTAVDEVNIDGKPATRLRIIAENPVWRQAQDIDLVEYEQTLNQTRASGAAKQQELTTIKAQRQLPATRVYEFFLDPQLGWAVVRRDERYEDGTLLARTVNTHFEMVKGRRIWMPRSSTVAYYTWTSLPGVYFPAPLMTEEIEATAMDAAAVPAQQFVLDYKVPGTMVVDQTADGPPRVMQVPATLADLDQAVQKEQTIAVSENPQGAAGRWNWLTVAALIAFPLAVLLLMAIGWYRLNHAQKPH